MSMSMSKNIPISLVTEKKIPIIENILMIENIPTVENVSIIDVVPMVKGMPIGEDVPIVEKTFGTNKGVVHEYSPIVHQLCLSA